MCSKVIQKSAKPVRIRGNRSSQKWTNDFGTKQKKTQLGDLLVRLRSIQELKKGQHFQKRRCLCSQPNHCTYVFFSEFAYFLPRFVIF